MADAVAGDMIERLRLGDIFGGLADHHPELDFPIGLFRAARNANIVVRANDGRRGFHEDYWFRRHGHAGLGSMI